LDGTCNSKVGYPVKDCPAGLAAYQDYLFGFAIAVPTAASVVGFGAIPSADGTWDFSLYTNTSGRPGSLVVHTGDVALTAYGSALEFPVTSSPIAAGTYWLMSVRHSAGGAICVSQTGTPIPLWQTNPVAGSPPDPFPFSDPATITSYQYPWNVYVNLQLPGT
jgi:hypothetical protein